MQDFFQQTEVQVACLVALFGVIGWAFNYYLTKRRNAQPVEVAAPSKLKVLRDNSVEPKKVGEIRFDYLPVSPLENGWKWTYVSKRHLPVFSFAANAPADGSLSIKSDNEYCMEYQVDERIGISCNQLKFAAKFKGEDDTMFWTEVEMATRDGSKREKRWIKFYQGNKLARQHEPPYDDEWIMWIQGTDLGNEWTAFEISLPEAVRATWGTQGWVFKNLKTISIRGNFSVSPIEFYQTSFEPNNVATAK